MRVKEEIAEELTGEGLSKAKSLDKRGQTVEEVRLQIPAREVVGQSLRLGRWLKGTVGQLIKEKAGGKGERHFRRESGFEGLSLMGWSASSGGTKELIGKHQCWEDKDVPSSTAPWAASPPPLAWKFFSLLVLPFEQWELTFLTTHLGHSQT